MVKIDVEGSEWDVLKGARTFLNRCKPVHILMEVKQVNWEKVGSRSPKLILQNVHGYRPQRIEKNDFLFTLPSPAGVTTAWSTEYSVA